jgi:hypothetical protein
VECGEAASLVWRAEVDMEAILGGGCVRLYA